MIAKCFNTLKDCEIRRKSERSKERGNRACANSYDDNDHKIYASMARMSSNNKRESKDYGDSSQFTNWILDSGATCHMKPEDTDFILISLEDTDKFIEVADGHHVTAKQKVQYVNKCLTITEKHLSRPYIPYYWHRTCVTDYFSSLR